jgi:hypothetical protein
MFSARRGVSGDDCLGAAFPADSLQGLAEAVAALERAYPSAAVPVLVASLNPYHWRSSRSAVAGLREQGRAALRAAPAVAGWLKLSVDHGAAAWQQDGINDALYRLGRLRAELDEADLVATPAALERVRRFFDEVFQPYLLTLLVPPVRYWQRGIVGYLEALNGDLETVATALHGFAVALREHTWGSGTNSDWDEYTHSETLALIGKLGLYLDRLRAESDWLARSAAEPPAQPGAPPAADLPSLPEQSVAWAQQELAAPSVSRRLTACRLLRQLGSHAQPAVPALRAVLAQLDGAALAAVAELREEALMTLREIEPVPEPATPLNAVGTAAPGTDAEQPPAPAYDRMSAEAGDRLLALAGDDTDSNVRTAALHAIADAGVPIAGALAVALRAAAADDPQERAAAARLLAMLAR